jgi:hypothetical protein
MKDLLTPSLSTKLVDQVAEAMKNGRVAQAAKDEATVVDPALAESTSRYMSGFKKGSTTHIQEDRISWNDMRNALMEAGHPALIVKNMDSTKLRVAYDNLEELSKKTLGSYIDKASDNAANKAMEHGVKKAERDEVDRMLNRNMKYNDKEAIHKTLKTTGDDVHAPADKARSRLAGIKKAVGKLTKEEAELEEAQGSQSRVTPMRKSSKMDYKDARKPRNDYDRSKRTVKEPVEEEVEAIDETTSGFRNRYQQIAKAVLTKNKNNRSQKAAERIRKRSAGMQSAGALNQKEANKRWDDEESKAKEVDSHMTKKIPGLLKAHGYQFVGAGGTRDPHHMYVKTHPDHGLITHVKVMQQHPGGNVRYGRTIAHFGSSTGWSGGGDRHEAEESRFARRANGEHQSVAERKTAAEKHFTDKIHSFETYHKAKALEESVAELDTLDILSEDLSEALVGKVARSAVQAGLVYAKHHEEINDLLKGISTHLKAHAKDAAANPWGNGEDHKGPHWGHVGSVEHYRNQLQNIHDSLAGRGQYAEDVDYDGDELNEELTEAEWFELEEAKRGRPRKNPLPNDGDNDADDQGSEANQNIVMQLRKASESGLKPFHVTFGDGEKHPVARSSARKVLAKFNSSSPSAREAMQAHMSQSHANLMSHLS